jgi:hypothetical protein
MIRNNEPEMMSRDTDIVASRQMFGGTEENHEEPHIK